MERCTACPTPPVSAFQPDGPGVPSGAASGESRWHPSILGPLVSPKLLPAANYCEKPRNTDDNGRYNNWVWLRRSRGPVPSLVAAGQAVERGAPCYFPAGAAETVAVIRHAAGVNTGSRKVSGVGAMYDDRFTCKPLDRHHGDAAVVRPAR